MNIWMIGKISMKHLYLKKKIFTVTYTWKILLIQILSSPELAWQVALKKTKVQLALLIHETL